MPGEHEKGPIAIHPFDFFVLLRDSDATDIYYEGEVDEVVLCPGREVGSYTTKNKLYRIKDTIYRVTCRVVPTVDEFEIPRGDGFRRYKTNPTP